MKKILIIAYYYPPFNNGGIQRIVNFQKYLPRFGYAVDVLTTDALGHIKEEQNVYRFPDKHYLPTRNLNYMSKIFIKIKRRINVWLGIVADFNYAWKDEVISTADQSINIASYDFIMASFPPVADLEIGLTLSRKYNVPFIADYRDGLMYDSFEYVKQSPFIWYRSLKLERKVAKYAVLQLAVNNVLGEYLRNTYNTTKTIDVYNGFDDEEIFSEEINIKLPNGFNIVYTGALGISGSVYEPSKICAVIEENADVNFVFIGLYLKKEKNAFTRYSNVYFYDQLERKQVIPIQRKADMLLLVTGDSPAGTHGKLFEYLFAKKPILNLGGNNVGKRIISETNSGETYHPTELQAIRNFIKKVKNGKMAFSYIGLDKYTRREQCKELAHVLDTVTED